MYNTVRSYVSAIIELWNFQIFTKLHSSLSPHHVAVKALKTSIVRGQHTRHCVKFKDRRLSTIRDRYTAKQIPEPRLSLWSCNALTTEQSTFSRAARSFFDGLT